MISREDLAVAGLISGPKAKIRRRILGEYLRIGYVNGKQLYKRLNLFQITPDSVKAPIPGPISITSSSGVTSAAATILFKILISVKKFCPKLFLNVRP